MQLIYFFALTIGLMTGLVTPAPADVAVCNSFGWRHGANTTCVSRPSKVRPATIIRKGEPYYWNTGVETYCFRNRYGNERCMDKLDLPQMRCLTQDGVTYCD